MRKLRVYLDTSVINFLFADDAPEKKAITVEFFTRRLREYEVAISELVIAELARTGDIRHRARLLDAVEDHGLPVIRVDVGLEREIARLAQSYLDDGILPKSQKDDAL